MRRLKEKSAPECPAETTLRYIGGSWKVMIVWHLLGGQRKRHAEMRRILRGVTPKILVQQLREMQQHGLIKRRIFPEIPPRVEYSLTALGESLAPLVKAMYRWGQGAQKRQRREIRDGLKQL
jgi:DNA-binding HxlR family transcriptional regulator